MEKQFDLACRKCDRLASFLDGTRVKYPGYHALPVPSFGDNNPELLIVGLAPGMHGANATGRPFTGDYAGLLLYQALYRHGFSSNPESVSADDGLVLNCCRITNAVKCLPPQNKPVGAEIKNCNPFLKAEIEQNENCKVILALGTIAHNAVLSACGLKKSAFPFGHGNEHRLSGDRLLIDSYHCSRYNVQTKRLTEKMFDEVFVSIRKYLQQ